MPCTLIDEAPPLDTTADVVAPRSAGGLGGDLRAGGAAGAFRMRGAGTKSRHPISGRCGPQHRGLSGIRIMPGMTPVRHGGRRGTRLTDLQAALAPDDMWVPFGISPWPEATVGSYRRG